MGKLIVNYFVVFDFTIFSNADDEVFDEKKQLIESPQHFRQIDPALLRRIEHMGGEHTSALCL